MPSSITPRGLAEVGDEQLAGSVQVMTSMTSCGALVELPSSHARELAFVFSHTIHHNAIIGTIARALGVELPQQLRHGALYPRVSEPGRMCTVTIVQAGATIDAGFRMACSRDESHGRAPALPPQQHVYDGVKTLLPVDPSSGGTWVGVNEHGVALTLLNYNLPAPPIGRDRSRGDVIPTLLPAGSVDEVISRAGTIERDRMMPFRLVACDGERVLLWKSTEPIETAEVNKWDGQPLMFTSSGLGDHLVEGPRRALFDSWFSDDPLKVLQEQKAFHRHKWPGQEHLSVCMHREDARTVSYTTIDVRPPVLSMFYHPDSPGREAEDSVVTLQPRLAH